MLWGPGRGADSAVSRAQRVCVQQTVPHCAHLVDHVDSSCASKMVLSPLLSKRFCMGSATKATASISSSFIYPLSSAPAARVRMVREAAR